MTAQYRLLGPHFIQNVYLVAGATVTEGQEVPTGWVPTLAVDPINTDAVNAFYAAGPRENSQEDRIFYPNPTAPLFKAVTYWKIIGFPAQGVGNFWVLTGLGANLTPIPIPEELPYAALPLTDDAGVPLTDDTGVPLTAA